MRKHMWIMLLAIILTSSFMSAKVFAEDSEDNKYAAEYCGKPKSISVCPDGENVDIIPNESGNDYMVIS